MLVLRHQSDIAPKLAGTVVGITIGNFDGLHLGHQALIQTLRRETLTHSKSNEPINTVALSFYPHPRSVLRGISRADRRSSKDYRVITPLREKVEILRSLGLDILFEQRFSERFAALEPEEFFNRFIADLFKPKIVVVGYDWSFGKGRSGDSSLLVKLGQERGIDVHIVPRVSLTSQEGTEYRVGSSTVKGSLESGDLIEVRKQLGRRFSISGHVVRGDGRGAGIGYPTANIHSPEQFLPAYGVYSVELLLGGSWYPGVANVGVRPTFDGVKEAVEVHLYDYSGPSFYRELVSAKFKNRIRGEQRFANVNELRSAIAADIENARSSQDGA